MATNHSRRCFIDVERREFLLKLVDDAVNLIAPDEQASSDTAAASRQSSGGLKVDRNGRNLTITRSVPDRCILRLYDLDEDDCKVGDVDVLRKWYDAIAAAEPADAEQAAFDAVQAAAALAVIIYVEAGFNDVMVYACASDAPADDETGFPPGRFLVLHSSNGGLESMPDPLHRYLEAIAPPFNSIQEDPDYIWHREFNAGGGSSCVMIDDLDSMSAMRALRNVPVSTLNRLIESTKNR